MNLWIRSQKKYTLMKVDYIKLCWGDENSDDYNLITTRENIDILLGTYKTKERALEVLDEIQGIIGWKKGVFENTIVKFNDCNFNSYVYQMPEE